MNRRLLNVEELSEYLGIPANTLYLWAIQERIPSVKCGRLRKFDLQKIDKWIEENSVQEKKFEHIRDRRPY